MRAFGTGAASLLMLVLTSNAQADVGPATWAVTGADFYQKCASSSATVSHACGEYLLGLLDGMVAMAPANAQVACPPSHISYFELETAYISWAKANKDLLGRQRMLDAGAALMAAYPCKRK